MKRHWVFALAALVVIPRLAVAQDDTSWGPRFQVTPFVGVSPGINQEGVATVYSGTSVTTHQYRQELSSALPLGVNAEYRFWNRFSVIGEAVFASRGSGRLIDFEDELIYPTDGDNFYAAKLAAGVRLRENNPDMQLHRGLNALLFVGPAYIRDNAKVSVQTPVGAVGSVNQWGLNVGAGAEMPLANRRLAFQLGLEDFMIFWDQNTYRLRVQSYLQQNNPAIDAVAIDAKKTNFWIMRAGLTFRF